MRNKGLSALLIVAALSAQLCGGAATLCADALEEEVLSGGVAAEAQAETATQPEGDDALYRGDVAEAPAIPGLTFSKKLNLKFATGFDVYYDEAGYKYLDIHEGDKALVVAEGMEPPASLPPEVIVIRQPLQNIYLANTAAMSLFHAMGGLDRVTMSSVDVSGWYIEPPIEALTSGQMIYAGKYSEPDYELLISHSCDLAIENTMIYHTPEVQEMILDLGIPVVVDRASYESHPLGRTEWVKYYGALLDKEAEAAAFFDEQIAIVDAVEEMEPTGKTVAFFSVNTDGTVVIRKLDDYIPNMLRIAGGTYLFDDLENASGSGSMNLSIEEFYSRAREVDYLVYNSTIEEPLGGIADLTEKSPLFAEFSAVQEDHVWQVEKKMYQSTDGLARMIENFHIMLSDGDDSETEFLTQLH